MGVYTIEYGYRKERRWGVRIGVVAVLIAAVVLVGFSPAKSKSPGLTFQLSKPAMALPHPQAQLTKSLPWPSYGQAAYGVVDDGVLATSDKDAQPVPIASLAKVITALAVLKQKPLAPGEQGPIITLTEEDAASYREYVAKSGTVVPIEVGEKISEYQALQAMLLPSANNMADTLARWAFGSVDNYNAYATNMLTELGFSKTIVTDASGYSPSTKSTATEMVKLGMLYIQNPVLKSIAGETKATIPFAGTITSYNSAINKDGILGLKVGFTDEAGKSFLVADVREGDKNSVSVVAVIGAKSLPTAMNDAKNLLKSGNNGHDQLTR